jgi:hypothetical protein
MTIETNLNNYKGGRYERHKKEWKSIKLFEAKLSVKREGAGEQYVTRQMDVGREQFVSGMKQFLRGPQNKTPHVAQIPRRLPHFSLEMYHGNKERDQFRLHSQDFP